MIGRLIERITARPPDFVIGGADRPYLRRWYEIPRNRFFNVYLHEILRSDDDWALHDHPWFNVSIILQGTYFEHTIRAGGIHRRRLRGAGAVIARAPWTAHRLEVTGRCFTLFLTGPRMRQWGFHCTGGWVHWRSFVNTAGGCGGNPRKS